MAKDLFLLMVQVAYFWFLPKSHFVKSSLLLFSSHWQSQMELILFFSLPLSLSHSQSFSLYASTKCHSPSSTLSMVTDKLPPPLPLSTIFCVHDNLGIFTSNSNIKDLNFHMCMNHITNGCLYERHMKQCVLFASGKSKLLHNSTTGFNSVFCFQDQLLYQI